VSAAVTNLSELRVELSRRFRFSASHRLHVDHLADDRNREIFGKCNNPFGHGHNYTVQVTVSGQVDAQTGMVVNLADIDGFVAAEVLPRFDYANLNEDAAFRQTVPSTENLCVELWRVFASFAAQHEGLALRRIRVEETNNNAFDYFGEGAPVPSAA
jgi:6-pyruvoyltetrahydropterin/6-carboxytetrahydropterin synthase